MLKVDPNEEKISLGMKQTEPDDYNMSDPIPMPAAVFDDPDA